MNELPCLAAEWTMSPRSFAIIVALAILSWLPFLSGFYLVHGSLA